METTNSNFDEFVLSDLPHFMAVNYQQLLDIQVPQERLKQIIHMYDLGLRALTIGIVSQYLVSDRERVRDPYLNNLLLRKFPKLTLDAWQELLFATLRAYEDHEDLFFMPELYRFYWDTANTPPRRRVEIQKLFTRLTQIALDQGEERLRPQDAAGWQQLVAEAEGLLREILGSLAFLAKYDLVRVLDFDNCSYDFELHRGLTIVRRRQPIPNCAVLNRGWFYLRRETADLLLLHPFLVSWEEPLPSAQLTFPADTAVYSQFFSDRLHYLLASLNRSVTIEANLGQFFKILFDTIEEVKTQRREAGQLTWASLQSIGAEISSLRMATVRDKYDTRRYLQREGTREAFERFLHSDKRCFVLTGKSGVGKSNFFLALADELQQRNNLCLLMYDGAQVKVCDGAQGETKAFISETISRDFDSRIRLTDHPITDIWREIADIDGINNRTVLLIVDAINENPQATELLRQLDDLVQGPWPWLKVAFSSRPETWRSIKLGVKLAEALYYRGEDDESLGVELGHFSYSEQLVPFSKLELPQAYAKYRALYGLQTPYEDLAPEVREMLADPFNLWLIAATYRRTDKTTGEIPKTLRAAELVQKYVANPDILRPADREFLVYRFMPLLIKDGTPQKVLTPADIREAGMPLFNAVYSEALLSDGTRPNQSFESLVNADILTRQGQGDSEEITFKYERFYEYFGGERLYELYKGETDLIGVYRGVIQQLGGDRPYLWGIVKHALLRELANGHEHLLIALSQTTREVEKELITSTLLEYGKEHSQTVADIVERLLALQDTPRNRMQRVKRALPLRQVPKVSLATEMAHRAAIEVAYGLAFEELLEKAACSPISSTRETAAQYIPRLWNADPDRVLRILEHLSMLVREKQRIVPRKEVLESFTIASIMTLFDHWDDPRAIAIHQDWKRVLSDIFFISPNKRENVFKRTAREQTVKFAVSLIINVFDTFVQKELTDVHTLFFSIPELNRFFKSDRTTKENFRVLVPYLDTNRDIRDVEGVLMKVAESRDALTMYLFNLVTVAHLFSREADTLPIIDRMFERALRLSPPGPTAAMSIIIVGWILIEHWLKEKRVSDTMLAFQESLVRRFLQVSKCEYQTNLGSYIWSGMECHVAFHYHKYGSGASELQQLFLEHARENRRVMREYTVAMADVCISNLAPVSAALSSLEPLLDMPKQHDLLVEILAWLRSYGPDDVEAFLRTKVGEDDYDRWHREIMSKTTEKRGNVLNTLAAHYIMEAFFFSSDDYLRRHLTWLFEHAPDCKSLAQWVGLLLRVSVNIVYGEQVFDTGQPPLRSEMTAPTPSSTA